MSDRTGIARGSLRPVIYFERPDGYVILPPEEIGVEGIARQAYEGRYRDLGWEWREAGTLADVDRLQKRLCDQEIRRQSTMIQVNETARSRVFEHSGNVLRSRMTSAATSEWERDFIRAYLKLRDEKRDKYRDTLAHHNYFIWAREYDNSTKVEDRLPLLPGQVENPGV